VLVGGLRTMLDDWRGDLARLAEREGARGPVLSVVKGFMDRVVERWLRGPARWAIMG